MGPSVLSDISLYQYLFPVSSLKIAHETEPSLLFGGMRPEASTDNTRRNHALTDFLYAI